jgi:hypothetical protein
MDASFSQNPASKSVSAPADASLSVERTTLKAEEFLSLTKDIDSKEHVNSLPEKAARQAIKLGLVEKLEAPETRKYQENMMLLPRIREQIEAAKAESDAAYEPYWKIFEKKLAYERTIREIETKLEILEKEKSSLGESQKSIPTISLYFLGSLIGACDSIHTQIRKNSAALVLGEKSKAEVSLSLEGTLRELKPKDDIHKAKKAKLEKLQSEWRNLVREEIHFEKFKVIGGEAFRVTALGRDAATRLSEVGLKGPEDLSLCLGVMAKEEAAIKVVVNRLRAACQVIGNCRWSKHFSSYYSEQAVPSILAASLPGDLEENALKVKEAFSILESAPISKKKALMALSALAATGKSLKVAKDWIQEEPAAQPEGKKQIRLVGSFFSPSITVVENDKIDIKAVLGFMETVLTEPEEKAEKLLQLSEEQLKPTGGAVSYSVCSFQVARHLREMLFPKEKVTLENCNSSRERVSRLLYLDFHEGRDGNPLGSEKDYIETCTLLVREEMGNFGIAEPLTLRVAVSLLEPLLYEDRSKGHSGHSGRTTPEMDRMKIEIAIALSEQARREYLQRTSPSIMPSSLFGPYYGN